MAKWVDGAEGRTGGWTSDIYKKQSGIFHSTTKLIPSDHMGMKNWFLRCFGESVVRKKWGCFYISN